MFVDGMRAQKRQSAVTGGPLGSCLGCLCGMPVRPCSRSCCARSARARAEAAAADAAARSARILDEERARDAAWRRAVLQARAPVRPRHLLPFRPGLCLCHSRGSCAARGPVLRWCG